MKWDPESVSDEQLAALARSVLDEDVVENVVGMALTGWDIQDPDAALARLVFDSAIAGAAAPGVRSGATSVRARTFEVGDSTIDFEETDDEVYGQVMPVPSALFLERLRARRTIPLDDHGQFTFPIEAGISRFRLETPQGAIVTEWFRLGGEAEHTG